MFGTHRVEKSNRGRKRALLCERDASERISSWEKWERSFRLHLFHKGVLFSDLGLTSQLGACPRFFIPGLSTRKATVVIYLIAKKSKRITKACLVST